MSFAARLLLLLAFLLVSGLVDRLRHGREARRPREYAWLLMVGGLGALFGLAVDQVTSRLSPEYFTVGKGLDPGPGFAQAVLLLSLQAGLVGGLVVGGALLLCAQPRADRPGLPLGDLLRAALRVPLCAVVAAPVGAALARAWDPLGLEAELHGLVDDPQRRARFVLVWGAHAGVYAGALLGTVWSGLRVARRLRPADAGPAPPPAPR